MPTPSRLSRAVTIVAIPHAGASSAIFAPWRSYLPRGSSLHPVTFAGRGHRLSEAPPTSMPGAVADVLRAVEGVQSRYVVFGHSMGALVAYETARDIRRAGVPAPLALIVSGVDAPPVKARSERQVARHELPDDELIALLRSYGGTHPDLLEPAVVRHFLPLIRTDLSVVDTYAWQPAAPLDIPVAAYGGTEDPGTTADGLRAWQDLTTAPFRLRMLPGSHFYLYDPGPVCRALAKDINWALGYAAA